MNKKRNILNGTGPQRPKIVFPARAVRDRHLISHLENGTDHLNCPTIFDEEYMKNTVKNRKPKLVLKAGARDFDILSNKFYNNDEAKQDEEFLKSRKYLSDKYWATRDYDLIRGRYYDDQKETTFKEQLKLASDVNGKYQSMKVPTWLVVVIIVVSKNSILQAIHFEFSISPTNVLFIFIQYSIFRGKLL